MPQESDFSQASHNVPTASRSLFARTVAAAALSVAALGAQAANVVVNGDFETGDLTGWIQDGNENSAVVSTDPFGLGSLPASGNFNALVRFPDVNKDGSLMQVVSFDATNLASLTFSAQINIYFANITETAQPLDATVTVGFFDANTFAPISTLFSVTTADLLGSPPNFAPGADQTGWTTIAADLTGAGLTGPITVGLGFLLSSTAPEGTAVMLGVDNVVFDASPVPVPPAWVLAASALVAGGRFLRRKRD